MTKTVVIYHSGYGHTKVVAEQVAAGAGADLIAISPEGDITDADWAALDAADAIVFGAPTYMGSASWQFKKFSDATSKKWFTRDWADKVFGGFTNSASPSGDKQVTLIHAYEYPGRTVKTTTVLVPDAQAGWKLAGMHVDLPGAGDS